MTQSFEPQHLREDLERLEKIKRIAYRLWLVRRDNNIFGDAEQDYFQAERLFDSQKKRKQLVMGSFGIWVIAFLAAQSPEADYLNSVNAVIAFDQLADEHDII
jgi:hypothetical protein